MFLFYQDYAHLGSDHIHIHTRNRSFLRMAAILKQMGIKNNRFFLMLIDKDLQHVDPHNLPNDSKELKMKIAMECKNNPWYFFRELIKVPEQGTDGVMFELNRANLSLIWLYLCHVDNLLIMPRQIGKTIGSVSIGVLVTYVLGLNTNFSMLAKGNKLRKANVTRFKDIRDTLPKWFVHKSSDDTNNSEEIEYAALGNTYDSYVAQNSSSGADSLGRGMTTPNQHWDEVAYFLNIDITYPTAIASTGTAVDNAKKNNQPYGNILTTTAGKLNTREGKYVHDMICSSLVFTEHLYDSKCLDDLHDLVKMNSKARMVYSEFSYKQLGKTDEWFEEKVARSRGTKDSIARDYLNRWTRGGSVSPLDTKYLDAVYKSKKDPVYVQYLDEFVIKWYIPKEIVKSNSNFHKIPIVLGQDCSENVGIDSTSFIFIDARNLEVIGVAVCNTINIIKVALLVAKLLMNPNIVYIPERNSMGVAILDMVLLELEKEGINPFYRIYNSLVQDKDSEKFKAVNLNTVGIYDKFRKYFGFRTTGSLTTGRAFLYKTVFKKALEIGADKINDIGLASEISGLTIKNGRIDHGNDGHDDRVIGYILGCMLILFGKNLNKYDAFKDCRSEQLLQQLDDHEDEDKGLSESEITDLKLRIKQLEKVISKSKNQVDRIDLIHKVNDLKKRLPDNADSMIADVPSMMELTKKPVVPTKRNYGTDEHIISYLSYI